MSDDAKTAAHFGAKGGKARAANLTKTRRVEIAQKAALTRWGGQILRATHGDPDHPLVIAGTEIQCYVLEDGQRVLSQSGLIRSMGMSKGGASRQEGDRLLNFATGKTISAFIPSDLLARMKTPIRFQTATGGQAAYGYEATILPDLCDAVLEARKAGKLHHSQAHIAQQCEILVRGFARVGIIALIDEATGYQDARARDALAKILEAFVAKELRKWVRTFPFDYYKELCRLRGVVLDKSFKMPPYFGHLTNDMVYARLAPGVLAELRRKNPTVGPGRRRHKHFQWLTEEIGDPRLKQHLWNLITLMRAAKTWDDFYVLAERALPRYSTLPLMVMIEQAEGGASAGN